MRMGERLMPLFNISRGLSVPPVMWNIGRKREEEFSVNENVYFKVLVKIFSSCRSGVEMGRENGCCRLDAGHGCMGRFMASGIAG